MENFQAALPLDLIKQFLATEVKLSFYVSGGCSSILGWLTLLPGSSKNVAETRNPYLKSALGDLLGYPPETFVDISIAKDLAFKAFVNTQRFMYLENENNLHFEQKRMLGVGATGALKTFYQKKGAHHLYFTLFDQKKVVTYYIVLAKDQRSREQEDYFMSCNLLNIITTTTAAHNSAAITLVGDVLPGDSIKIVEEIDTIDFLLTKLEKQIKNIIFLPKGEILADQVVSKCIVIPGSFNPLHDGHIELGECVAAKFGVKKNDVIFELSAMNADKGLIPRQELDKRIKMIVEKGFTAMLTHRPFFYDKNEYLREGYFVVGADTYKRIVDTKYYSNSKEVMNIKLSEFDKYKNRLVVAPRLNPQTNELEVLGDYEIPEVLKLWVKELEGFRVDVSSTEIRKKMQEKEEQANKPAAI